MNTVFILTGGNLGDRIKNLNAAKKFIQKEIGNITTSSSIYETAAWGITEQPDFLNQVLVLETNLSAKKIIEKILFIENKMGRIRKEKNASRIIDIDILFFNNEVIHQPRLTIPHPEIKNRKFVLVPLNEISPNLYHPVLHKTIFDLLHACEDALDVKIFPLSAS
jgi:2-amino-4-hydroxy-6-hydroxymethyldihydropteridine diphosphokinase